MIYLFVIAALPVVFFMLVWVVVTAYRIWHPEQPRPLAEEPFFLRHQATAAGVAMPVGAREIREDQRQHQLRTSYHYATGGSDGLPLHWRDDLWLRRN